MDITKEVNITVSLKPHVKVGLDALADENGRATKREAAHIIEEAVVKAAKIGQEDKR